MTTIDDFTQRRVCVLRYLPIFSRHRQTDRRSLLHRCHRHCQVGPPVNPPWPIHATQVLYKSVDV